MPVERDPSVLNREAVQVLWHDWDQRETLLRRVVTERLAANPPAQMRDHVVASYFFALRSMKLHEAVEHISYHATSGIKHPPTGSLLEQCSAKTAGVDAFDETGRLGLLHVAFPLKMMLQPDGHLTSCDLLHTTAGAVILDVYENQDARLVWLSIPPQVIATFPGPAHGPAGVRKLTDFPAGEPAFGTILKPTAGITAQDVGRLVGEVARCPMFLFVKEDEDLYPNLDYAPLAERTRLAVQAIAQARDRRGGRGLLFAPHITCSPHELLDTLHAAMDAGASAVMLGETFAGGAVRMVREATKRLPVPPAIYGHNAGIGVKTRGIFREVIDLLARLDGIDFRQTAPVKPGEPFLRPYGQEWEASERVLSMPIEGIKPTMIARAGALDQGNIGMNLADAEQRGISDGILFLAGSAINSIKNAQGRADPQLGAEAMRQAIEIHRSGELRDLPAEQHIPRLLALAQQKNMRALRMALEQRYGL